MPVDLLGEENHVPVIRNRDEQDFPVFKVIRHRHSAPQAVSRVDGETHVYPTVDYRQAGIVEAVEFNLCILGRHERGDQLARPLQCDAGLGLHFPVDSIVTESQSKVGPVKARLIVRLALKKLGPALRPVVIAENHDVASLEFRHTGIEKQAARIGDVGRREQRVGRVAIEDANGLEKRFSH